MTFRALTLALAIATSSIAASAQAVDTAKTDTAVAQKSTSTTDARKRYEACETGPTTTRFFSLANASQQTEANDILVAVRNILCPADKIYLVGTQNIIVVRATADEVDLAQRVITELDHARKSYRLLYTVNELDSGKLIGSQHYAMVVVTGQLTTLKQGSKVPVLTGSYSSDAARAGTQTQFTYLDIGMNFAVTLDELTTGVRLRSKVEQSSIAENKTVADVQEPLIRQAVLEGAAFLIPGKPVTLGSIDITGTTRHLDIEVVMEPVK